MTTEITGANALCEMLARLGVDTVFGLPGTQTTWLYEAFRTSRLRTVTTTHELAAAFMAVGYYRSSGRVAAVTTIPGPGLTYALTGLAEARFDSAALLLIVVKPKPSRGNRFRFQDIDQAALVAPIAKAFVRIAAIGELVSRLCQAHTMAIDGEPGPVVIEIESDVLGASLPIAAMADAPAVSPRRLSDDDLSAVCAAVQSANRRVLLVGQGASAGSADVVRLAEQLGAIVVATSSGRGIVPEDHPQVLPAEYSIHDVRVVNELCRAADLVVVLGCKLGHNGAAGFRLELPEATLVHIDASSEVLGANYPARIAALADVPTAVRQLLSRLGAVSSAWSEDERAQWRRRAQAARTWSNAPVVEGAQGGMEEVLGAIRAAAPRDACLVTDSGLHQMVARTWWNVLAPRSLVTPADFQSMGFGLPAAIGAAIASPDRRVILVIGDGGLAMSGMELLTAVRENVRLLVVLCNDHGFGLIRRQQVQSGHVTFAVDFGFPDACALAVALGAEADAYDGSPDKLRAALASRGVFLLELLLRDHPEQRTSERNTRIQAAVRGAIKKSRLGRLRRLFRI